MTTSPEAVDCTSIRQTLSRLVGAASVALVLLGAVVLIGWLLDVQVLKTVLPQRVSMKANTAVGFLVSGLALYAAQRQERTGRRSALKGFAAFVFLLGAATLVEFAGKINLHIDTLLFADAVQVTNPGRPSFITAICFALTGCGLFLLSGDKASRSMSQAPAVLVTTIAYASITGYLYGVPLLYGSYQNVNAMAIHTGIGFLVLGIALLLAYPESTAVELLCASETGGWLTRRFLPLVIFLPVLLGYLYLRPAMNFGQLRFGMAMFAVSLALMSCSAILSLAVFLNKAQRRTRRAERALLQSEKLAAVGTLAASIAHEINNPVDAVMNLLYLARAQAANDEVQELLGMADRELQRVAAITSQTLSFQKQAKRPEPALASAIFDSVITLHEGRLRNTSVYLERRDRADRPVSCFSGEIRQVLGNLVANAIDAMRPGGRLLLRSRNRTHPKTSQLGIQITVADTGCGMDRSTLDRVFEAFFTTKDIGGNGLGLWISQEILVRHGSRMRIRSRTGAVHGTVFTFFLPSESHAVPAVTEVQAVPVLAKT